MTGPVRAGRRGLSNRPLEAVYFAEPAFGSDHTRRCPPETVQLVGWPSHQTALSPRNPPPARRDHPASARACRPPQSRHSKQTHRRRRCPCAEWQFVRVLIRSRLLQVHEDLRNHLRLLDGQLAQVAPAGWVPSRSASRGPAACVPYWSADAGTRGRRGGHGAREAKRPWQFAPAKVAVGRIHS